MEKTDKSAEEILDDAYTGTLFVFTTDGPHFTQFLMLLFFALAFIPLGWVTVVVTWVLMHAVKFVVNKMLLK